MAAAILDGKKLAGEIRLEVKAAVERLKAEAGIVPGLAVILVGEDPGSEVYVRNKMRACDEVGFHSQVCRLSATTTEAEIAGQIAVLNADPTVHGILLQLPLPYALTPDRLLELIDPAKDVDGLHPVNAGKLLLGQNDLVACTPSGIIELLRRYEVPIAGKHAVVIGRSSIVGKPMALLLLQHHATVTICHSRTADLAAITRQADILVAAVGRPAFVTADMVKPGAVVIDVGTNRLGKALVGDVDFVGVSDVAGMITPVPGGVGPLTIAMLLRNTLQAAMARGERCGS